MMNTKLILCALFTSLLSYAQEISQTQRLQINRIAEDFMETHNIPGMAISIAQKGSLEWSKGYGFSDIQAEKPVSPSSTQFRLASISKPLTAYAMGILADKGALDFDESLYRSVPDFPKKKYDFSLRQIGGHLAGIRHYKGSEFILNKKMSIVEGLSIFKNDPLKHQPGSKFLYSTYGWNLLSVVVQNVSKEEFNTFMVGQVFTPLQMNHTRLDLSDQEMPLRTKFYLKTNAGKIKLGPEVSNEHKAAGGGFVGTSEDLIRFGQEVLHPTLLSVAIRDELIKEQFTTAGKSVHYGIGFNVGSAKNGSTLYSHSGGGVGASTLLLMYPDSDLVIVLLTNLSSAPIRELGNALEAVFLPQN